MEFPNLVWAARQNRLTNYRLAAAVGMSESGFSRRLNGRLDFSLEEKRKIADFLGYDMSWLFAEIVPPQKPENVELITA